MTKDPWYDNAACKGADPADFDLDGHGMASVMAEKRGKFICAECPVRMQCLEDALAHEAASNNNLRWGLFGGLNPVERAKLAKQREKAAS